MSSRPTPRRSSLAGANPVAPPSPEPAADTAPQQDAQQQVSGVDEPARARKPAKARTTKYPPKVSFYQDREDTDRVRGAILHTMPYEGGRSLSQFIHQAVMAEVERLEKKYNGGRPFPPVGARELPQGRPMGE